MRILYITVFFAIINLQSWSQVYNYHYSVGTSCNGGSDGYIELDNWYLSSIALFILPYTYQWSNGETTQDIYNLSAGLYFVTITGANGDQVIVQSNVEEPDLLTVVSLNQNPSCETCMNGTISTIISGGTSPYTFYWSTGETSQNITSLLYGIYGLTVIDDHVCEATEEYFIMYNPPDTQKIELSAGWNMFSTYKSVINLNLDSLLSSIQGNYSIFKNWEGEVFMPQYGVNTIDTVEIEYGFQIKMNSIDTLFIPGSTYVPDNLNIYLPLGWCMIGYPRYVEGDIVNMMNSIVNHILIMKDEDGKVYWPDYGVNLINIMHPGDAYQIKTDTVLNFIYPAYGSNL